MPLEHRGRRVGGLLALFALSIAGGGCQMSAPGVQTAIGSERTPPRGLIANVQSLTGSWNWSGGGSPTARLYKQPTNVESPPSTARLPLFRTGGATPTSTWAPIERTSSQGGMSPQVTHTAARYPTPEPTLASQIPVTTLPGPPPAFGGHPTSLPSTFQPVGGRQPNPGMAQGAQPQDLPTLPDPRSDRGNGKSQVVSTSAPALPVYPMKEVGPVAPLYPSAHKVIYTPAPTNPISGAIANLQEKIQNYHTAAPIKYSMPVPREAPREFEKRTLPPYIIEPPDVLLVQSLAALKDQQPINFEHRVRPDGTIGLGIYGEVYVAGMTLAQAKEAIIHVLKGRLKDASADNTTVDIIGYLSKKYYVITDGGGYGEQVYPFPITGNETVLDALANINGLPAVASKRNIWIARATPDGSPYPKILPVDWKMISQYGSASTNYQILPNDRIYVKAENVVHMDTWLARRLSPIERIFGTTLLGSSTANSIRNLFRANGGGGNNFNNFGN